MVRHPALREIIGADTLAAIAGANLALAVGRTGGMQSRPLRLVHARAQYLHRLGAVLVLAPLLLHGDDNAGRQMRDADRTLGLVHMLSAGARRTVHVDAQIALVHLNIDLLRFGQNGDSHGTRVDASLRFGRGHTLHAVHAGFVLQPGKHVPAGDLGNAFLQATKLGFAILQQLETPAAQTRIFLIRGEQFGGEQTSLVTTRGRANFQDRAALVRLVARQQRELDLTCQFRNALAQLTQFLLRHLAHFRIGQHLLGIPRFRFRRSPFLDARHHRFELRQLLRRA